MSAKSDYRDGALTENVNYQRIQSASLSANKHLLDQGRLSLVLGRRINHQSFQKVSDQQKGRDKNKASDQLVVSKAINKPTAVQLDWTIMPPIKSHVKYWFGEGEGKLSKGIVYGVLVDQIVYAPIDGEIVFAGVVKDFGYVVMIEKDHQNLVLLSGISYLKVSNGDIVYRGQGIGTMVKGGSLYLEFRNSGFPVDPKQMLASG